jgi:hypothetical protein
MEPAAARRAVPPARRRLRRGLALAAALTAASCGLFSPNVPPPPRSDTEVIWFKTDRRINDGMLLPAEIIYVTADREVASLTAIGPDAWFDSPERDKWPHKTPLMFRNGQDLRYRLREKPPETHSVVVFFSFYGVDAPEVQQVILGPDEGREAVIWIGAHAVYH